MAIAIYYLCLVGILPAVWWAMWIGLVMVVASQQNLGGVFRLAWRAFLTVGSWYFLPGMLLLAVAILAWFCAGVSPVTRGYGHLATGVLGLATIGYLLLVMPRQEPAAYLLLVPSLTAAVASALRGVKAFL